MTESRAPSPATELLEEHHLRTDAVTGKLKERRYELVVESGAQLGRVFPLTGRLVLGSAPDVDIPLDDTAVSRRHLQLTPRSDGVELKDLGSRNGVSLGGARVDEALVTEESVFKLGRTFLRLRVQESELELPLGPPELAGMVGPSRAMRHLFAQVERVAHSDAAVLLQGETGTGKDRVAKALHSLSPRRGGPFVVFDCGAVAPNLIESELFGHKRGAFTGAEQSRSGAFVRAGGGTLFLDEVAELPLELQPRLLRALESRTVTPLGADTPLPVDVRVIAATHRILEQRITEQRFRQDLYFRLAVVTLQVPPLRARFEDLPALIHAFAKELGHPQFTVSAGVLAQLTAYGWPGNLRELRNTVARTLLDVDSLDVAPGPAMSLKELPYKEAKERILDLFTRDYVRSLLEAHGGSITEAAKAGGIARGYFHRLVVKLGLRGSG